MKSILVDRFIKQNLENKREINGKWWVSRTINPFTRHRLWTRICCAFEVLIGKAVAVHYKEDEPQKRLDKNGVTIIGSEFFVAAGE